MRCKQMVGPKPMTTGGKSTQLWAAVSILGAALAYSLAPAILHLSSAGANPFYFNIAIKVSQVLLIALFVVAMRKKFVSSAARFRNESRVTVMSLIRNPSVHFAYWRRVTSDAGGGGLSGKRSRLAIHLTIQFYLGDPTAREIPGLDYWHNGCMFQSYGHSWVTSTTRSWCGQASSWTLR